MTTFSEDCLANRSVLITGGLGAIGTVVVDKLLSHGARVTVNDIVPHEDASRLISQKSWPVNRCRYVRADVTKPAEVGALVEQVVAAFGQIDVALCHAGMVQSKPIFEITEQDWDKVLDLNLKGAFLVSQAAARSMVKQDVKGKIIFTSSWVQDVPWPGIASYNASKSGLKMLMRSTARELAVHGIRSNALAPGIVAVGLAKRQWDTDPDYRRRAEKAIPLGFMQTPESVADACLFLCSDASNYMTGTTVLVDGGSSLYPMD